MPPPSRPLPATRALFVAPLVGLLLALLVPTPAAASAVATLERPAVGEEVTGGFEVLVRVERSVTDPPVRRVEVELDLGDGVVLGPRALECRAADCDASGPDGAPYRGVVVTGDDLVCNGEIVVRVGIDGAFPTEVGRVMVREDAPQVTDLRVAREGAGVIARFTPSADRDVTYVLERRLDADGNWADVVSGTTGLLRDSDPSVRATAYRVRAERGDGRDPAGGIAAACTDGSADLTTTSSTAVVAADPDAVDEPTGGSGDDGSGGGTDDEPDGQGGDPDRGGADGDGQSGDGTGTGDGTGGATGGSTGSTGGGSVAPPPPPSRSGPSVPSLGSGSASSGEDAAQPVPRVTAPEDDTFEPTLDFGEVDPVTGEPVERPDDPVGSDSVVVQALERTVGQVVDVEQLLRFLGVGALLLALAYGVRRWQRGGAAD